MSFGQALVAAVVGDHFPRCFQEVEGADRKAPGVSLQWEEEVGEQHRGLGDQTSEQPWLILGQGHPAVEEVVAMEAEAGQRCIPLEECCSWICLTVLACCSALLRAWPGFGSGDEPVCCI